ncbi:hypothetical protein, partial [Chloroflexus sp. MS-G]|uniref:hypothetical protein n=1 Tax=Chloroflexus sp. MS-G TaxID=1521187 RepID=UPI001F3A95E6
TEVPWARGLPAHSGGGFDTRPHHGATDALGVRASSPQVSCTGCARIGLYYRGTLGVRASSPQVSCTGCVRIGLYYRGALGARASSP